MSDALGEHLLKEEEERDAKAEVLENSTDRMENVLERVHGELNSCAEKLGRHQDGGGQCWDKPGGPLEDQVRSD